MQNPQLVTQHCFVASFGRCFPFFTMCNQLVAQQNICCGLKKVVAKSRTRVYFVQQILALLLVFHQTHNLACNKFARTLANQPIRVLHFFDLQQMFLLRIKLIMQGEKWVILTKTCNETMLRTKMRVFVSRILPPSKAWVSRLQVENFNLTPAHACRPISHTWLKTVSFCHVAWHNFQKYVNLDQGKERKSYVKRINNKTFFAISDFWSEKHWERVRVYTSPKTLTGTSDVFGRLQTSSDDFGLLRKTSEIFRNLRKWMFSLQKSQHSQGRNLRAISQKVGRFMTDGRQFWLVVDLILEPCSNLQVWYGVSIFCSGLK